MKRPLAVVGFSYLLLQMIIIILPQELFAFLVVVLLLSFIVALICKNKFYKNILLIGITAVLAFACNYAYLTFYVKPVTNLVGQTITVTANVLSTSDGYNEETKYANLFISEISAYSGDDSFSFKTTATMPYVISGEIVEFTAVVSEIDTEFKNYFYANGVFVGLENVDNIEYVGSYNNFSLAASGIQKALSNNINKLLPPLSGAIVNAMALGNESYLTSKAENVFRNSGLSHILVVSGLHISLVCGAGYAFFTKFSKRKIAGALVILLSLIFVIVTGITPSSVRACTIMIIFYSAIIFNKKSDVYTSLGFAALIVCVQNPYAAVDASTLLSFSATFAVLLVANYVNERKLMREEQGKNDNFSDKLLQASAIPFAASIATLPILIMFGFSYSLVGVLANIIVLNLVPTIVIGGIILSFSAQFAFLNIFSILIGAIVNFFVAALYFVADILGNLPGAVVYISGISAIITVVFAIALVFIGKKFKISIKLNLAFAAVFILLSGAFYYTYNVNTASVEVVKSGEQTSAIISKHQSAALVFASSATSIDDIEYAMQKYNIQSFDIIFDLRLTNETGNLSEVFNCNYIVNAQDILNNEEYIIFDDVFVNVFHQENGNYASITIHETDIGIAYNRVDMNAYEPCDIFILNNAKTQNLKCHTIWSSNEMPEWILDENSNNNYENIIGTSSKLLVRTNTGDYKWEENYFDIK